jgi:hypothetical protein
MRVKGGDGSPATTTPLRTGPCTRWPVNPAHFRTASQESCRSSPAASTRALASADPRAGPPRVRAGTLGNRTASSHPAMAGTKTRRVRCREAARGSAAWACATGGSRMGSRGFPRPKKHAASAGCFVRPTPRVAGARACALLVALATPARKGLCAKATCAYARAARPSEMEVAALWLRPAAAYLWQGSAAAGCASTRWTTATAAAAESPAVKEGSAVLRRAGGSRHCACRSGCDGSSPHALASSAPCAIFCAMRWACSLPDGARAAELRPRGSRVPMVGFNRSLGGVLCLFAVVSACASGQPPPSGVSFGVFGDGGLGAVAPKPDEAGSSADAYATLFEDGSGEADPGDAPGAEAAPNQPPAQDGAGGAGVCDPSCAGCCDSTRACVTGSSDTACGKGGGPCADCNAVGSTCQPGGTCALPSSGSSSGGFSSSSSGSSGSGSSGGGGCSSASCPTGCCQGGTCHSGASNFHCGAGGATCVDCTTTMQTCLSHQCG